MIGNRNVLRNALRRASHSLRAKRAALLPKSWCNGGIFGVRFKFMALNIKNQEVERLVNEVIRLTGETKTEAIRQALAERREHLSHRIIITDCSQRLVHFLEREVWPTVPPDQIGRHVSREEKDAILGYGANGV